jgi:O-antigen/teichoic acid export membrane protein
LFGAEFAEAAPALPILLAAFVSISFGYLAGHLVVVLELQRRFLRYAATALVLNVVLNVILIPRYGFMAAAWTTLATELTVMSLTMRAVLRGLGMRPALGRLARIAAAAAAMGALVAGLREAGLPLGGLVAAGAASYLAGLVALRALTRADLRFITERA